MKKKILIIFMCFTLLFTAFVQPVNKAQAFAPFIPAVANPAVASWIINSIVTVGTVSVAAYKGIKDYDNIKNTVEGIKTVVATTWNTVTEDIKQDLYNSITNAKDGIVYLSETFTNWFKDTYVNDLAENAVYNIPVSFIGKIDRYGYSSYDVYLNTPISIYGQVYRDGTYNSGVFKTITFDYAKNYGGAHYALYLNGVFQAQMYLSDFKNQIVDLYITQGRNVEGVLNLPSLDKNIDNYADQVGKNLENVFNRVRKKGISLPPTVIGGLATGGSILWNPNVGDWVYGDKVFDGEGNLLKDAGDIYDGDFTDVTDWTVPDINVSVDETGDVIIGADGIPVTGTKEIDIPDVVTIPSIDVIQQIPVADVPIQANPKKIRWERLFGALGDLSTVFPFSLPWDISRAFNAIFPSNIDELPSFKFDFVVFGEKMDFTITIPEYFDNWVSILRNFIVLFFDISMIYAIYRLFGGQT